MADPVNSSPAASGPAFPLSGLFVRRRLTVLSLLAVLSGLGWLWLVMMSAGTTASLGLGERLQAFATLCLSPAHSGPWGLTEAGLALLMWLVMSMAMMLPTAAPMVLTFGELTANRHAGAALHGLIARFVGGYLVVWGGFSVLATGLQGLLHGLALMTPDMAANTPWLAGGVLIAAGIYQFTPLKDFCLTACRNPMTWFFGHWRGGPDGAWRMGMVHGLHCLGCCWALMLVMFAGGLMNLAWIAVLAALMLAEKALPKGDLVGKAAGLMLAGWGGALILAAL